MPAGTVVSSGSLVSPGGAQGVPGPNAVSTDAGNQATFGTDSRIYVPSVSVVLVIQKFTASGTYTPTAKMTTCIIECVGGGSGGNGASGLASYYIIGGGGGGGAYARKLCTAAQIGASKAVTIGAGGSGGTGTPSVGSPGGDTSVGVLCIAKGAPSATSVTVPGVGGSGASSTGDYTVSGATGGFGIQIAQANTLLTGGAGGASLLGPGAQATIWSSSTITGSAASGYGGGGGGGSIGIAGGVGGGAGLAGIVIITELCMV